jgi:hypothetical protein
VHGCQSVHVLTALSEFFQCDGRLQLCGIVFKFSLIEG